MAIWTKNPAGQAIQQNQLAGVNQAIQGANVGGALGSGHLQGLAGSGYTTSIPPHEQQLQLENHRLRWELQSQKSIRAMDSTLLKRHYRIWAWLMDTHPEVIKEFEAVESLLKASGEEF